MMSILGVFECTYIACLPACLSVPARMKLFIHEVLFLLEDIKRRSP